VPVGRWATKRVSENGGGMGYPQVDKLQAAFVVLYPFFLRCPLTTGKALAAIFNMAHSQHTQTLINVKDFLK